VVFSFGQAQEGTLVGQTFLSALLSYRLEGGSAGEVRCLIGARTRCTPPSRGLRAFPRLIQSGRAGYSGAGEVAEGGAMTEAALMPDQGTANSRMVGSSLFAACSPWSNRTMSSRLILPDTRK